MLIYFLTDSGSNKTSSVRTCINGTLCVACSDRHYSRKKSITYYDSVSVAIEIQHAKHMHHITLSSVACLALYIFFTFSHKMHSFREKLLNIKCFFYFLCNFCMKNFHSKKNSAR